MARKVKLRAPRGTDEANFDNKLYRVDNNGTVEVDEAAVEDLCAVGGFEEIIEPHPVQKGFSRARSTNGTLSCSWGGQTYEPDADGVFLFPIGAMADMASHGFVGIED